MKILIGSSSPPDNGAGISTYCREIAMAFIHNGHSIVYASPVPESYEWLLKYNITHIPTPMTSDMNSLVSQLLCLIEKENVDGIVNNDNVVLQNIAPLCDVSFLSICHLDSTTIFSMLGHNINWVDYTVAISSDMQCNLVNKYSLSPYQCPVVYNGITDPSSSDIISQPNVNVCDSQSIKVIFGGGLIRRKGGDMVLQVLKKSSINDNVDYHIYGELPNGIPEQFKASKYIYFYGKVYRDLYYKAVSQSDVFLMPSRAEGCPMVLIEAMSHGLIPIVSNGLGAMRWMVDNSQNGYVCTLNDWSDQCLSVLRHLQGNRIEVDRLKANSRATFIERFTSCNTVIKLEHLLKNPLVNRNNKPTTLPLISWHRYPNPSIRKRLQFRLGILSKHGIYKSSSYP